MTFRIFRLLTSDFVLRHEFLLVGKRAFAGDHFEILVKAGKVVEPALIAKLLDAEVVFDEQFAGLSHPDLDEELRVGLAGPRFEIPAEGIGADVGYCRDLFQLDLAFIVFQGVFIDRIHAVVLCIHQVVLEADGREGGELFAIGNGIEGFHEDDDPFGAIGVQEPFQEFRYLLPGLAGDLQAAPGFFQYRFDVDVFRQVQELLTPEVLTEMRYPDIGLQAGVFLEIEVVKPPVVGQVGAHQHDIARLESFDTIANELGSFSLFEMDQFDLGMVMPAVIDVRHQVPAYAERMAGACGNFK